MLLSLVLEARNTLAWAMPRDAEQPNRQRVSKSYIAVNLKARLDSAPQNAMPPEFGRGLVERAPNRSNFRFLDEKQKEKVDIKNG
jgi:hypothetical protein